jgi:hypothetical protein
MRARTPALRAATRRLADRVVGAWHTLAHAAAFRTREAPGLLQPLRYRDVPVSRFPNGA